MHEIPTNPGSYEDPAHSNLAVTTIHDIRIHCITYYILSFPTRREKKEKV